MIRVIKFSVSYPLVVLGVTFLCTASALVFIPNVNLRLDARSLVPSNDPSFTKSDHATKVFDIRDVVIVGIVKEESDIYDKKALTSIQELTGKISSVDGDC
jgi:predicted RND superfamily exporter protein